MNWRRWFGDLPLRERSLALLISFASLFGVVLLPLLGAKYALLGVSIGYVCLIISRPWKQPSVWGSAGVMISLIVVVAIKTPPLRYIDVPDSGQIVSYNEGAMAAVSVVQDADEVLRLRINNRAQEGSSATQMVDGRQAWLPLLLHPQPQRALFLGVGTGVTSLSATVDANLQVDAVELLPEIIDATSWFASSVTTDAHREHLRLIHADARRFVRTTHEKYDLIVADNFHPARSGSGTLYTVEHFKAIDNCLTEDGVFVQWLPLHQLDLDTLRSIMATYLQVFPHGWAMLASNSLDTPVVGLVGGKENTPFKLDELSSRQLRATTVSRFSDTNNTLELMGNFFAGPTSLHEFSSSALINTDDHPVVVYLAPRITYAPDSQPRDRLIELLQATSIHANELLDETGAAVLTNRLSAYWRARNEYLRVGRDVQLSNNANEMLRQLHDPLLSVLHISSEFRPALRPLLHLTEALRQTDSAAADALASELHLIEATNRRP